MKNIFSSALAKFKEQYVPVVDNKIRMTMDGNIACPHAGGFTAFVNGELVSVPEELLLEVPVYRIQKPLEAVQVGDVIKTGTDKKYTYHKVVAVKDGNVITNTYGGTVNKKFTPIKDLLLGAKTVSVVVNLFGNVTGGQTPAGGLNPMMLMALADGDKKSKLLPLLLMNQGQGSCQGGFNPMMLLALGDDDSESSDAFETMLMMQMMGGQNPFAGLCGLTPVATTATDTAQA